MCGPISRCQKCPGYAFKSVLDLKSLLRTVTQKTKVKLAQHVKELVLTPGKRDGEEVYEVSGEWELLPEKKCVILLVARDGIEPPTPAFSGPPADWPKGFEISACT